VTMTYGSYVLIVMPKPGSPGFLYAVQHPAFGIVPTESEAPTFSEAIAKGIADIQKSSEGK